MFYKIEKYEEYEPMMREMMLLLLMRRCSAQCCETDLKGKEFPSIGETDFVKNSFMGTSTCKK